MATVYTNQSFKQLSKYEQAGLFKHKMSHCHDLLKDFQLETKAVPLN